MARQVSWESRLHEIRRSVANSVRSHYDRRDLELLFKLQPRAAGKLLEILRTDKSGRSLLIDRATLVSFLDGAHEADDVAAYCAERRQKRKVLSRRKPRAMVRRDTEPVPAASLSAWLKPGMLSILFSSMEELADVLWRVASAMRDDMEEFAKLYEPEKFRSPDLDANPEVRAMFEELEKMEQADTKRPPRNMRPTSPLLIDGLNPRLESPTLRQTFSNPYKTAKIS